MNGLYNNINDEVNKRLTFEMKKLNEEDKKKMLKKIKKDAYIALFSSFFGLFALLVVVFEWYSDMLFLSGMFAICLVYCLVFAIAMRFIYNKNSDKMIEAYIRNKIKKETLYGNLNNQVLDDGEVFNPTKSINLGILSFKPEFLHIDISSNKLRFQKGYKYSKVYSFKDIFNYEVYENGDSVVKGTAGKSLIGGLFFGLGGMIVAGNTKRKTEEICSELKLVIRINDIDNPQLTLTYIDSNIKKSSSTYKTIKESLRNACSTIEFIINNKELLAESEIEKNEPMTKKEQLLELQELLDEGLISEEEFKDKKRQILGL